jgi:hypothetical protein
LVDLHPESEVPPILREKGNKSLGDIEVSAISPEPCDWNYGQLPAVEANTSSPQRAPRQRRNDHVDAPVPLSTLSGAQQLHHDPHLNNLSDHLKALKVFSGLPSGFVDHNINCFSLSHQPATLDEALHSSSDRLPGFSKDLFVALDREIPPRIGTGSINIKDNHGDPRMVLLGVMRDLKTASNITPDRKAYQPIGNIKVVEVVEVCLCQKICQTHGKHDTDDTRHLIGKNMPFPHGSEFLFIPFFTIAMDIIRILRNHRVLMK